MLESIAGCGASLVMFLTVVAVVAYSRQSSQAEAFGENPAEGDEQAHGMRHYIRVGRVEEVLAALAACNDWEQKAFLVDALSFWRGKPNWVQQLANKEPRSADENLLLGTYYIWTAILARGRGKGSQVAERRFRKMFEHLETGVEFLEAACAQNPHDPTPHTILIRALRYANEPERAEKHFEEVRRRAPEHRRAHREMLTTLCEKWHGSHDQMYFFVTKATADLEEGNDLAFLIPLSHLQRIQYARYWEGRRKAESEILNEKTMNEIERAWLFTLGSSHHRQNAFTHEARNCFAAAFALGGRYRRAAAEFDKIGSRRTMYPWIDLLTGTQELENLKKKCFRLADKEKATR